MTQPANRVGDRRERGAVLVLTGIVLTALLAFTSIALDLGFVRVVRRDMQALADVVALDLVRRVNGDSVDEILAGGFEAAKDESVARNDDTQGDDPEVVAELGAMDDVTDVFVPMSGGGDVPNAVRVTARANVDYFFRPGSSQAARTAIATNSAKAQFEVGAFLANVSSTDGGLLDQLFDANLGANVLSPNGLSNSTLELEALQTAIGIVKPGAAVNTQLSAREFLLIAAKAAELNGQTADAVLLNGAAAIAATATTDLTVGDLVDMYFQGSESVAGGSINLFGYVHSGVMLMDGEHVLNLTGAGITIPGAASPTVTVSVVNPSTMSVFGPVGVEATNQQLEVAIRPNVNYATSSGSVNSCNLSGTTFSTLLGGLLSCIGGILGSVVPVSISVGSGNSEIALTGARATGRLTAIDCGENPSITVTPVSFTAAGITAVLSLAVDVTIAGTTRSVQANVPLSFNTTGSAAPQTFLDPTEFHVPRTVGSTNLGLANSLVVGPITFNLFGLVLGPVLDGLVQNTVGSLLTPLLTNVDTLLDLVATQIGANLGGAQITAHERACTSPRLAG